MKIEFTIKTKHIVIANIVAAILVFVAGFIRHINLHVSGVLSGMVLMFAIIEFSIAVIISGYYLKHSKKSEDEDE